jgi:hypothetical protein
MNHDDLSRLHQFIENRYDMEELRTLCFDLGVGYDDLRGEGRSAKARELVGYMERRDQLGRLLDMLRKTRPEPFAQAGFDSMPVSSPRSDVFRSCIKSYTFPFNEPYYPLPQRETEIQSVMQALRPGGRSTVMVTGLGGMGKTALAVEVARRCAQAADQPFRAITWDSAKQEFFVEGEILRIQDAVMAFAELVDSLGRQLAGPDFVRKSEQEKLTQLKDSLDRQPCLVIVDNLETMENAQEIVLRLHGLLGPSRALITSRKLVPVDAFTVRLDGLPEENTIAFLRAEGRQRNIQEMAVAEDDTLREIHRVTQGMPLAMKLVAGQAELWGLDDALSNLREGRGDIYSFLFLGIWRRLSDPAKKLLLYMGPTVGAVGREELEIALEMQADQLDQAIRELVRLSLLNLQGDLRQRLYSIHQLTRYFVVNDLPEHWKRQGLI